MRVLLGIFFFLSLTVSLPAMAEKPQPVTVSDKGRTENPDLSAKARKVASLALEGYCTDRHVSAHFSYDPNRGKSWGVMFYHEKEEDYSLIFDLNNDGSSVVFIYITDGQKVLFFMDEGLDGNMNDGYYYDGCGDHSPRSQAQYEETLEEVLTFVSQYEGKVCKPYELVLGIEDNFSRLLGKLASSPETAAPRKGFLRFEVNYGENWGDHYDPRASQVYVRMDLDADFSKGGEAFVSHKDYEVFIYPEFVSFARERTFGDSSRFESWNNGTLRATVSGGDSSDGKAFEYSSHPEYPKNVERGAEVTLLLKAEAQWLYEYLFN